MKIEDILTSDNLADELEDDVRDEIISQCMSGYEADVNSRAEWKEKMADAMKIALQVMEPKNDPWPNASNVKFPLITIAAMQYHARAYPALINGTDIVKCRGIGADPESKKQARAIRVSQHMSYQVMEQDESWESEMDKLLIALPIMGSMFKKSFYCPDKGHNVSYTILPNNLVVDYYATSLDDAERVTEEIKLFGRVITERQRLGIYRKIELMDPKTPTPTESEIREGRTPPDSMPPHNLIEQHCYYDLDKDGYEEPYIITIDKDSREMLRMVPRFDQDSVIPSIHKDETVGKIVPDTYYTKYTFIPSPDGGFYELGFGVLLGPINRSINTVLNELIDAGKLANLPSFFMGRGARLKKGKMQIKPGQGIDVNATGDDLRKNIVPLPFGEPSGTLFNLLQLLITYGERTSSVTEIMTGQMPGQNTPATTSVQQLEQSQKVFTGIYKRNYRDMRTEFRKLYILNSKFLDPEEYFTIIDTGDDSSIYFEDYQSDPTDIRPAADPSMSSKQERMAQATTLMQMSNGAPGYNIYKIQIRALEALEIPNIEEILPDPQGENAIPQQPDIANEAKMMSAQADAQYKAADIQIKAMLADGQLLELETRAILNLAKAESEEDGTQIALYNTQISELKEKREVLREKGNAAQDNEGGYGGMGGKQSNPNVSEIPQ